MENIKAMAQLVPTAMQALTTPASPRPIGPLEMQKFAAWLRFQTLGDPQLEQAAGCAAHWAAAFKRKHPPCWLSLVGRSGTGKTHIIQRLFDWSNGQFDTHKLEWSPVVVYWPRFVQRLRSGEAFRERDDMLRWPVLALDDVGSERDPTGFASEELNTMLGCRQGKWTLITSNLDLDGIAKIDERIADRLIRGDNICTEINAVSYSTR